MTWVLFNANNKPIKRLSTRKEVLPLLNPEDQVDSYKEENQLGYTYRIFIGSSQTVKYYLRRKQNESNW